MIFSLLRVRKKTSASLAGIAIGAACLWGVALWQDLTLAQLLSILGGTVLFVGGIILLAVLLIASVKGALFLARRLRGKRETAAASHAEPSPASHEESAD